MPNESDRDLLVRIDQRTQSLHEELLGAPGREGRVPMIEKRQEKHSEQISFWRGSIAVVSFLILVFGGILVAHLLGGR